MNFFSQMNKKKEVKEPRVKKVQSPEVLQVCLRIDMKKKEINTEFEEKKR
jgi:hypothetical protein